MRSLLAVGVLQLALGCANAAEDRQSGNFFFKFCKAGMEQRGRDYISGNCHGTIAGIAAISELLPAEFRSCPPANAPRSQAVRVVVKYLEDHPGELNKDLEQLIVTALREAWPCKK